MPDQIEASEVHTGAAYEETRAAERRTVAESQRHRRIALGHALSLVFETRDSIRVSLEEMLRSEDVSDPDEIAGDIEAFNELVPAGGRLGATLYVEATDPAELATQLAQLDGVRDCLALEIGDERIRGVGLEGEAADELAPASYLVFALTEAQRLALSSGAAVSVVVSHPHCSATVVLSGEQRAAIASER